MTTSSQQDGAVPSLAVLPFAIDGDSAELAASAHGLAGIVARVLSGTPGLRVVSPDAALRFAGSREGPEQIGAQLHADRVVAGSIRSSPGAAPLQLAWQMVDVPGGDRLHDDVQPLTDAGLIEDISAFATRLAAVLDLHLPDDAVDLAIGTRNPDALRAALLARFEVEKETEAALERAERCWTRAMALDPDWLDAHVGLFDTLRRQLRYWYPGDAKLTARCDALLERIRSLDPTGMRLNWEALAPKRDEIAFLDVAAHEARNREGVLRNRVDIDTGHSARHDYAAQLSESGLFRGALDFLLQCEQEELPNAHRSALIGHTLAILGDLEGARERLRQALTIDPHFVLGTTYLIAVLDRLGEHETAAEELERIAPDLGPTLTSAVRLGGLYWRGEEKELQALVVQLESDRDLPPFFKGIGRIMLHDDPAAITWFEQGYRSRDTFLRELREKIPFHLGDEPWERLMLLPRFRILLRTIHLDDAWRTEHMRRANLLTPVTGITVTS